MLMMLALGGLSLELSGLVGFRAWGSGFRPCRDIALKQR